MPCLNGGTKATRYIHFLDAILVDSLDVLGTVDQDERDEMTKAFKDVPEKWNNRIS